MSNEQGVKLINVAQDNLSRLFFHFPLNQRRWYIIDEYERWSSRNDVASLYNPAFSGTLVYEEQSNQRTCAIRAVRFLQCVCFSGRLADGYPDFCTSRRVSIDLCISAFTSHFLRAQELQPQKEAKSWRFIWFKLLIPPKLWQRWRKTHKTAAYPWGNCCRNLEASWSASITVLESTMSLHSLKHLMTRLLRH